MGDRPRDEDRLYVPPAKLSAINDAPGPMVSIFFRPDKKSGSQVLFNRYPRAVAEAFSPRLAKAFSKGDRSFVVFGGDIKAHRELLQYFLDCTTEGKVTPLRTLDIDTEAPFTLYPKMIESAGYFDIIPLQRSIYKRLMFLARKNLMSMKEAEMYLGEYDLNSDMMDVVVESVGYGWWEGKFDDNQKADEIIEDLRAFYPAFDLALEKKINSIPDEIKVAKEVARTRRMERDARDAAENGGDFGGEQDGDGAGASGAGDWTNSNVTTGVVGDWDKDSSNATPTGSGDWDSADNEGRAKTSSDWCDQVDEAEAVLKGCTLAPAVTPVSGGW